MDTIKVKVTRHGNRKYMVMYYDDPTTGQREQRSTKQTRRREAERTAAKWEAELREGRYRRDSRMTWEAFRDRHEQEKMPELSRRGQQATDTAFNHLERLINPKWLTSLTEATLSRFKTELRKTVAAETSVATHLRHLKAALNWAAREKIIAEAPNLTIPKLAKGQRLMRGRPITAEEFDRMIAVVPRVRAKDANTWTYYLEGLWLSGLRLEESTIASWDDDAPFMVDLSGRRPRFRIYAEAHKGRRDQYLTMTPDFAEFLFKTPEDQRQGRVFKIDTLYNGKPMSHKYISRIVAAIGKRAGVIVNKADDKCASAHDLRRSFGSRWARRVTPAILQQLMRHRSIDTTMKYYVDLDADDLADQLWREHGAQKQSEVTRADVPQPQRA